MIKAVGCDGTAKGFAITTMNFVFLGTFEGNQLVVKKIHFRRAVGVGTKKIICKRLVDTTFYQFDLR